MGELLAKISSYDIINSFIPGILLLFSLQQLAYFDFAGVDIIYCLVFAYLLGLIGSRVGSLILEPIARRMRLIERDYPAYLEAQKKDEKITSLNTVANMYRSIAGSLVVLAVLALGSLLLDDAKVALLITYGAACFVLFIFSWIKQDKYISKRINHSKGD